MQRFKKFIILLSNNKKYLNMILTIIIILIFFLAIKYAFRGDDIVIVNNDNRALVMERLDIYGKEHGISSFDIFLKKIFVMGVGIRLNWLHREIICYYLIGYDNIGMATGEELEKYIEKNGTSLEDVAVILIKFDLILIIIKILLKIYLYRASKKESNKLDEK